MDDNQSIAEHYTHGSLELAIFEALSAAGKDLDRQEPADLVPVDAVPHWRAATRAGVAGGPTAATWPAHPDGSLDAPEGREHDRQSRTRPDSADRDHRPGGLSVRPGGVRVV